MAFVMMPESWDGIRWVMLNLLLDCDLSDERFRLLFIRFLARFLVNGSHFLFPSAFPSGVVIRVLQIRRRLGSMV